MSLGHLAVAQYPPQNRSLGCDEARAITDQDVDSPGVYNASFGVLFRVSDKAVAGKLASPHYDLARPAKTSKLLTSG